MKTQKNPQDVNPRKCNRCWSWFTATAVAVIAISFANRSSAVPVTFSGGSGTPLTITLSEPVTYQITLSVPVDSAPFFVLQDVTNGESGIGEYELSGNVTFSINSGSHQSALSPSGAGGLVQLVAFGAQDVYLSGPLPGVTVSDTVIISAGTLTTLTPFPAQPPANGDFNTFIADSNGNRISNLITATIPDTGTTFFFFGISLMGLAFVRRKLC